MRLTPKPIFLFRIKNYENKGLTLLLDIEINYDADRFKIFLSFKIDVEFDPDLLVRDYYSRCVGIKVDKNELLSEEELDFYELNRTYKIDQCSLITKQLAEETKNYISALIFEKLKIRLAIEE